MDSRKKEEKEKEKLAIVFYISLLRKNKKIYEKTQTNKRRSDNSRQLKFLPVHSK